MGVLGRRERLTEKKAIFQGAGGGGDREKEDSIVIANCEAGQTIRAEGSCLQGPK